jgi:hypothetical protein
VRSDAGRTSQQGPKVTVPLPGGPWPAQSSIAVCHHQVCGSLLCAQAPPCHLTTSAAHLCCPACRWPQWLTWVWLQQLHLRPAGHSRTRPQRRQMPQWRTSSQRLHKQPELLLPWRKRMHCPWPEFQCRAHPWLDCACVSPGLTCNCGAVQEGERQPAAYHPGERYPVHSCSYCGMAPSTRYAAG